MEWQTPKTDWQIRYDENGLYTGDYFEAEDYQRIVGNIEYRNQSLGKAGRVRWMGRRPRVRGVVMNPVDHPMGGGEGRTSGGGHPVSPWGQLSKGYPTRRKSKPSNSMILLRRNGKKAKK